MSGQAITLEKLLDPDGRILSAYPKTSYHRKEGVYSLSATLRTEVMEQEDPLLLKVGFSGYAWIYKGPLKIHGMDPGQTLLFHRMPRDLGPEDVVRWWNETVEHLDQWKAPEGEG